MYVNHLSNGRTWTYFSFRLYIFPKNSSFHNLPVFIYFQWRTSFLVEKIHFMTSSHHIICHLHPQNAFHILLCDSYMVYLIITLLLWKDFSGSNPLLSIQPNICSFYHIYWHLIMCHFAILSKYFLAVCALYS